MLRTFDGDGGATDANGADANGGIMRRVSGKEAPRFHGENSLF